MTDDFSRRYILVVDDDPTMQMVLQGMIEKAGFKPVIADDGQKALQFIEIGGANISVVLLDRQLPDMNGLEVVKTLQGIEENRGIPVVMQSGSKSAKDIKEAIDAGIFHYLTKPYKVEALQNVLNFAIWQEELQSVLADRLSRGYAPANLMRSASFEFSTFQDAKRLAILLSSLFPDPFHVLPGVEALLFNAVEHGSLGIGYDAKTDLINSNDFRGRFYEIQNEKATKGRIVEVQFIHKDGRYSIRITDDGKGFDWKKWIAFKEERDSFVHGYGILKALLSFDEVKYNTAGNQVMASVFEG